MKLILLFFASFSIAYGAILELGSFKDLQTHLTPDTLVILDIDDTLLIPPQMLGCDEWFNSRLKDHRAEGHSASEALEKSLAEWEGVRHLTKMEVVEPGSEVIVKTLQNQGYKVMGLTTQGLALATRTSQQLMQNHFDLKLTSPSTQDAYFNVNQHGVLWRNGILFTSGTPKGKALFALCDKIDYVPKRIVFVNDKKSHLAEVESEAIKRKVEFIGLRYSYSDARKKAFSKEIADYEFEHSSFSRILSDDESRKRLCSE